MEKNENVVESKTSHSMQLFSHRLRLMCKSCHKPFFFVGIPFALRDYDDINFLLFVVFQMLLEKAKMEEG